MVHFLENSKFASLSKMQRDGLGATLEWIKKDKKPSWPLAEILSWEVDEAWKRLTTLAANVKE